MIGESIDVLHSVTSSLSLILFRGQLRYLRGAGFHPAALSNRGKHVEDIRVKESVPALTVDMEREISPLRDLTALVRLIFLVRHLNPLISNAGTPKAGLLVGLSSWINRTPCRIYTLRGLRLETAQGMKRRVLALMERIACGCAHRVVCVSPSLRQRVIDLGLVREEKTVVLSAGSSNGIDVKQFERTQQRTLRAREIRKELGIPPDAHVVGYIGRFTRDKGIQELLAAFRILQNSQPDSYLMLIGDYEEGDSVSQRSRAFIEADPRIIRVTFTPEIAPYYLVMDVFVLPTYREGFPNTVLEAQAAGRAVVTTQATGAVDSVLDGVTGIVVPVGDSTKLADAISTLLSDPALAKRMGGDGYQRVCRDFQQEKVWGALASLYREMLQERGLPLPSTSNTKDTLVPAKS